MAVQGVDAVQRAHTASSSVEHADQWIRPAWSHVIAERTESRHRSAPIRRRSTASHAAWTAGSLAARYWRTARARWAPSTLWLVLVI